MLVAKKYEYYENYQHDYDWSGQEQEAQQPRVLPKQQAKPSISARVIPIVMVLIGFAMASLIVMRFAMISENNQQIMKLNAEIAKQYKIQEELELELASRENLDMIEDTARFSLGMSYPTVDQVKFVEFPKESNQLAQNEIAQQTKPNVWERILQFMD